jgi:hypothetical protein
MSTPPPSCTRSSSAVYGGASRARWSSRSDITTATDQECRAIRPRGSGVDLPERSGLRKGPRDLRRRASNLRFRPRPRCRSGQPARANHADGCIRRVQHRLRDPAHGRRHGPRRGRRLRTVRSPSSSQRPLAARRRVPHRGLASKSSRSARVRRRYQLRGQSRVRPRPTSGMNKSVASFCAAASAGIVMSAAVAWGHPILAARWSLLWQLALWAMTWVIAVVLALRLPRRLGLMLILVAAVGIRVAALAGPPTTSDDLYRYSWDVTWVAVRRPAALQAAALLLATLLLAATPVQPWYAISLLAVATLAGSLDGQSWLRPATRISSASSSTIGTPRRSARCPTSAPWLSYLS